MLHTVWHRAVFVVSSPLACSLHLPSHIHIIMYPPSIPRTIHSTHPHHPRQVLDRSFHDIFRHGLTILRQKFYADAVQGYVNKYFASVVGFLLTLRPVLYNHNGMAAW